MVEVEEIYKNPNKKTQKPSKLLYLLPIFLGIIGGVIGYVVAKDKDKKMATNLLIVGIIISVISVILIVPFFILFYYGIFAPSSYLGSASRGFASVSVLPPWDLKSNGDLSFYIENRVGGEINIRNIYVNDKKTTSTSLPILMGEKAKSYFILINTQETGSPGNKYSITLAIEYCLTAYDCTNYFNSTGMLSGSFS
ncbi:MAG: hypothetical protein GTN36_04855 [Candidatus Aenigmarchaeota archaeon]|nr:hypothetical protein [Candidatus Aenigmarchaeota archaeon]